jgi:hypothetical protein
VSTYGVELPEHEAHNTFILVSNLKMREIESTYQFSQHGVVLRAIVINDMIYLLTAIGLSPGDSSTIQYTFTHKQYIERYKTNNT